MSLQLSCFSNTILTSQNIGQATGVLTLFATDVTLDACMLSIIGLIFLILVQNRGSLAAGDVHRRRRIHLVTINHEHIKPNVVMRRNKPTVKKHKTSEKNRRTKVSDKRIDPSPRIPERPVPYTFDQTDALKFFLNNRNQPTLVTQPMSNGRLPLETHFDLSQIPIAYGSRYMEQTLDDGGTTWQGQVF